jgi:arylsulfatase A-like enzyme
VQGRSLVPLLRGESPADWRRSIYYHYYDPGHAVQKHYGIRTERHTLAHFYPVQEWELYDLQQDPRQLRSLHADPAHAAVLAELKGELTRLRALYQDTDEPRPAPADARPRNRARARATEPAP